MTDSSPLVSIGMPVYNGGKFIRQTLESLLAQDYNNFEIIISDNASTDETPKICQEFSSLDKRIQFFQNKINLGGLKNFTRVLKLSSGKYFMWASDHDLWDCSFISRCVSNLEMNQDIVLVYSRTMLIDSNDNQLELTPDKIDTRGMTPIQRYKHVIWNLYWCNMFYGLIRHEALNYKKIGKNIYAGDHLILAELALKGIFIQINEPLFFRRKNRPDEKHSDEYKKRVIYAADPITANKRMKKSIPDLYLELRNAHIWMLMQAPLGLREKLQAIKETLLCFKSRFGVKGHVLFYIEKIWRYLIPNTIKEYFS